MADIDEFAHMIKLLSGQQAGDFRPTLYGHVSSYDPKLHRVRVIFPGLRDQNDTPMLSPWLPLSTLMVGNGFGIQFAPVGGATIQKPTDGEQVKVTVSNRDGSIELAAALQYSEKMLPPFTDMKAGEFGIKHQSKSSLYFDKDGNVTVDTSATSGGKVIVNSKSDVNISTPANVNITASGSGSTVTIKAPHIVATNGGSPAAVETTAGPSPVLSADH